MVWGYYYYLIINIYFIDRNFNIYQLKINNNNNNVNNYYNNINNNMYFFDGELIIRIYLKKELMFLSFDCWIYHNKNMTNNNLEVVQRILSILLIIMIIVWNGYHF